VSQCPVIDPDWENPNGVPVDAFVFGGRRYSIYPLVTEALNWEHGVFLGSLVSADNMDDEGKMRVVRESFAMMPYCAYDMVHYFEKWLETGKTLGFHAPKIFYVNWFKKDEEGRFLWPGFRENGRVLKWIFQRIESTPEVVKTPLGYVPSIHSLDWKSLDVSKDAVEKLLQLDSKEWREEAKEISSFYSQFGEKFPEILKKQLQAVNDSCS
jgi:phosphoenolpyruvate carboxykinase (GTP)